MHLIALLTITPTLFTPQPDAKAAWETIKAMAGEWQGVANDGRKIKHTLELIAGGSVLMEKSWFDAHPGQLMVTMYQMDGDRLILTHYCVAKNAPLLEATEVSGDGKNILFTFKGGANIPDRDKVGHMDKASYSFIDKDTFKSKWTWFKDGKEQWMEEFTFHRATTADKLLVSNGPAPCCKG